MYKKKKKKKFFFFSFPLPPPPPLRFDNYVCFIYFLVSNYRVLCRPTVWIFFVLA